MAVVSGKLHMWYKNHKETVPCIDGAGSVEDLTDGGAWDLRPGVLYALDKHQQHILRCEKGMTVICCFTPSLVGPEDHDEQASYALLDDDGSVLQRGQRRNCVAVCGKNTTRVYPSRQGRHPVDTGG
ncbi:MAG: ectoine synthase [Salinisphaera sp.]|nr:ectoine synthase [Salinisphaera sp.]